MPTSSAATARDSAGKLLIVDDEEPIRIALTRTLRRLGYEISDLADPAAGLAAISTTDPEVVFLDLRMPLMDGHTFMRKLNAASLSRPPAIVVMSGHGNMDDVIEAMRLGAVDYLRKPWGLADLVSVTARAVEARRRTDLRPAESSPPASAPPPSALPPARAALFADLPQKLRRGEVVLPATPMVLARLRELVESPESSIDDITSAVEQDPRVAADLLRVANSALYARLGRAPNVRAAVTRLGLRHIHNLVQTISLQGFCDVREGPYRKALSSIWLRSVAKAISMRALCDLLDAQQSLNADTAYLVGLMSDVGASLLLWIASERSPEISPGGAVDAREVEAVMEMVRRNHDSLSTVLLESWKFDKLVGTCSSLHHMETPPSTLPLWWSLQVLGDHLATRLVGEPDLTARQPRDGVVVERCAAELAVPPPILERLVAQLRDELSAVRGPQAERAR
jgi:HD-like signal output (HDOD) protein/DNA-binding NarL/FixJ family response regulator